MAYTTPTITASAGTYAQAKTQGLRGRVAALITANAGLTARQKDLLNGLLGNEMGPDPVRHFDRILSNWLKGDPISITDINAELKNCTTAVKAMLAAMEELCVHVDANPGTLGPVQYGPLHTTRRTLA